MTFRVGMKVVCILNKPWRPQPDLKHTPFYKGVYTIRGIRTRGEDVGLCFVELRNPPTRITDTGEIIEPVFDAAQFRPIVERKTDISFAHEILRKVSRNDRVRA